jgi:hypothetical protein
LDGRGQLEDGRGQLEDGRGQLEDGRGQFEDGRGTPRPYDDKTLYQHRRRRVVACGDQSFGTPYAGLGKETSVPSVVKKILHYKQIKFITFAFERSKDKFGKCVDNRQ